MGRVEVSQRVTLVTVAADEPTGESATVHTSRVEPCRRNRVARVLLEPARCIVPEEDMPHSTTTTATSRSSTSSTTINNNTNSANSSSRFTSTPTTSTRITTTIATRTSAGTIQYGFRVCQGCCLRPHLSPRSSTRPAARRCQVAQVHQILQPLLCEGDARHQPCMNDEQAEKGKGERVRERSQPGAIVFCQVAAPRVRTPLILRLRLLTLIRASRIDRLERHVLVVAADGQEAPVLGEGAGPRHDCGALGALVDHVADEDDEDIGRGGGLRKGGAGKGGLRGQDLRGAESDELVIAAVDIADDEHAFVAIDLDGRDSADQRGHRVDCRGDSVDAGPHCESPAHSRSLPPSLPPLAPLVPRTELSTSLHPAHTVCVRQSSMSSPRLCYRLGCSVYVAVTNRCNSVTLNGSRGPGFVMPAASGFEPLPDGIAAEPSPLAIAEAVAGAFAAAPAAAAAASSSVPARPTSVVFAGVGEPLLRLSIVEEATRLIMRGSGSGGEGDEGEGAGDGDLDGVRETGKDNEEKGGHTNEGTTADGGDAPSGCSVAPPLLRLNTNGLVPMDSCASTAMRLKQAGIGRVSVAIATHDPALYLELMRPTGSSLGIARTAFAPPSFLQTTTGTDTDTDDAVDTGPVIGVGPSVGVGVGVGVNTHTATATGGVVDPAHTTPGHAEVVAFVRSCVEVGLAVECTAVEAPGVDMAAVNELACSLGASFKARTYFPSVRT